jgi:hypothetical protein
VLKAAHDAEEFYEDRGARISILAGRRPPRPDTLKQTDQPSISTKPLADGAGHTFSTQFAHSGRRPESKLSGQAQRWPRPSLRPEGNALVQRGETSVQSSLRENSSRTLHCAGMSQTVNSLTARCRPPPPSATRSLSIFAC